MGEPVSPFKEIEAARNKYPNNLDYLDLMEFKALFALENLAKSADEHEVEAIDDLNIAITALFEMVKELYGEELKE